MQFQEKQTKQRFTDLKHSDKEKKKRQKKDLQNKLAWKGEFTLTWKVKIILGNYMVSATRLQIITCPSRHQK